VLVNVRVDQKKPFEDMPAVVKLIAQVEAELAGDGRVLVRYSGTEAKARVMIEGPDEAVIRVQAEQIAAEMIRLCKL
jgi:phosphoglucosamine mutase